MITLCWEQAFYLHCSGQLRGRSKFQGETCWPWIPQLEKSTCHRDVWGGKFCFLTLCQASQVALVALVKNPPANVGDERDWFDLWVRKIPWRRAWQPTLVFLPGESHWTEEPGRLQFIGSQKVRHNWSNLVCTHAHTQTLTFLELKNVCTWLNPTTEYKHAAAETTHF